MRARELKKMLQDLQKELPGDPAGVDVFPDLPIRFPLRLQSVDRNLLDQYTNIDDLPQLDVDMDGNLIWVGHGTLGTFLGREQRIISDLGPWLALYAPRMIEVSASSGWVAIELVRPVLSVCPRCKRVYPQGHMRCERCDRKLQPELGVTRHIDFTALRPDVDEDPSGLDARDDAQEK